MKVVRVFFHRLYLNNGFLESDPVLERFQYLKVKSTEEIKQKRLILCSFFFIEENFLRVFHSHW